VTLSCIHNLFGVIIYPVDLLVYNGCRFKKEYPFNSFAIVIER